MSLDRLPPWAGKDLANVVVETPRGSAVKLKFDPALAAMTVARPLPLGVVFPFDFGFVPGTHASDGDPLDVAILLDVPTYPGVVVRARPIGVLRASQAGDGERVRNDRLVAIAQADRRHGEIDEVSALSAREREEIEAFFCAAVALEGKELAILGWGDAREARAAIEKASRPARGRAGRRAASRRTKKR